MSNPYTGQSSLKAGTPVEEARGAVVLLHGRGGSARDMLALARRFHVEGAAHLAPQAVGSTWYPHTLLDALEMNEPNLTFALGAVGRIFDELHGGGIPSEKIVLLGFSQGGCLGLEYAARHPRRYGGVVGLSAGLIGPPGTTWTPDESLDGTPVFLGCSDVDTHIPKDRVEESAEAFREMGGEVDLKFYEGVGHMINQDEMEVVRGLLEGIVDGR